MTPAERRTRVSVLEALQRQSSERGFLAGGDAGLVVSTHQRRPQFSLRHDGGDRVSPEVSGLFGFWFGPALLVVHSQYDEDLEDDPDYAGALGQAEIQTEDAYGAYHSRYLDVELGKMSRNWGPPGLPGLLVSDWPLSYDHLYVRLGPRRINMSVLITQLDDAVNSQGEQARRFFLAHRLNARVLSWLDLAVWQGTVLSGPNRNLQIWYLNPIQPTYFASNQHQLLRGANFLFGGDGQMRLGRFVLSGSAFFDDWDILHDEPPAMALTATASTRVGSASIWLGYTLVSNLAYRTNNPDEKPLTAFDISRGRFGVGLARNFSDYDQATLRVTTVPMAGVLLEPELTVLRQGEGDPRLAYPSPDEYDQTPTLFAGVVERTLRLAINTTVHLPFGVEASLNLGVHRTANAGHQVGEAGTDVVGTAIVRYGFWHIGSFN